MCSGEGPIGTAKRKQPNTEALCQPPPPPPPVPENEWVVGQWLWPVTDRQALKTGGGLWEAEYWDPQRGRLLW